MKKSDERSYSIRISVEAEVFPHDECHTELNVDIVESDTKQVVGGIDATLFHTERISNPLHLFEVFDSISGQTCAGYGALDESGLLYDYETILFIETVNLKEEHRGRNVAREACLQLMLAFANASTLVILRPTPTEDRDSDTDDEKTKQRLFTQGVRRLRKYWRQIGFTPLEGVREKGFFILPGERLSEICEDLADELTGEAPQKSPPAPSPALRLIRAERPSKRPNS